jgi:formylglycine-generating enzyme required for sulfatase activity
MARMLAEFKEPKAAARAEAPVERNQRQAALPEPQERPSPDAASDDFADCDRCPMMSVVVATDFAPRNTAARRLRPVRTLAISKSEVTVAEWNVCVRDGACAPLPASAYSRNRAAVNVSRSDALNYAEWLSQKTGKVYRPMKTGGWSRSAARGPRSVYARDADQTDGSASSGGDCDAEWGGWNGDPNCIKPNRRIEPRNRREAAEEDASGFRVARTIRPDGS